MNEYSCVKSFTERYDIRVPGKEHWAIFTISDKGGVFSVTSDTGNYAHNWPSHGDQSLKQFILTLDDDYVMTKLVGRKTCFDYKETIRVWRAVLLNAKANGELKCYECDNALKALNEAPNSSAQEAIDFIRSNPRLGAVLHDHLHDFQHEWDPGIVTFMKYLWIPFRDVLRRELAREFGQDILIQGVTGEF